MAKAKIEDVISGMDYDGGSWYVYGKIGTIEFEDARDAKDAAERYMQRYEEVSE